MVRIRYRINKITYICFHSYEFGFWLERNQTGNRNTGPSTYGNDYKSKSTIMDGPNGSHHMPGIMPHIHRPIDAIVSFN